MEFASDMLNLRREINSLRAARTTIMNSLHHFNGDFKQSMARKMSEMARMFAEDCARARSDRHFFNQHNRRMVGQMIGAFHTERQAARRHFMGKSAELHTVAEVVAGLEGVARSGRLPELTYIWTEVR
jgi:hypothetical protein